MRLECQSEREENAMTRQQLFSRNGRYHSVRWKNRGVHLPLQGLKRYFVIGKDESVSFCDIGVASFLHLLFAANGILRPRGKVIAGAMQQRVLKNPEIRKKMSVTKHRILQKVPSFSDDANEV